MMNFSTMLSLLGVLSRFITPQRAQQAQQPQNQSQVVQGTQGVSNAQINNFVDQFIKANNRGR